MLLFERALLSLLGVSRWKRSVGHEGIGHAAPRVESSSANLFIHFSCDVVLVNLRAMCVHFVFTQDARRRAKGDACYVHVVQC